MVLPLWSHELVARWSRVLCAFFNLPGTSNTSYMMDGKDVSHSDPNKLAELSPRQPVTVVWESPGLARGLRR